MPINPVDVVGNFQRGYQFGAAQKEQRRVEGERNQLKNLAPRVLQGDASAYQQAAAIDPGAAGQLQDASDRQFLRLSNVVGIMRQAIDSGKPEVIQQAHQKVSPWLAEITGRPVPPQWTPDMLPNFERIEQQVRMAQSGQPQQQGMAPRVVGNALVDSQGKVLYQAPHEQDYQWSDRAGAWIPKPMPTPQAHAQETYSLPAEDGSNIPTREVRGPNGEVYRVEVGDPIAAGVGAADTAVGGNASAVELPNRDAADPLRAITVEGIGPKIDQPESFITLTPQEVAAMGLPAGTVAQRNTRTGNVNTLYKPDARPGTGGVSPLSAGEAAKVRTQFKETKDALNTFKAFDTALGDIPSGVGLLVDGDARGRLGTAYNNARAALRILYNTGVLQPGELPMLEAALRDPNSFTAIMDPRTRPQIQAQLDELYRTAERNIDNLVDSYPQLWNKDVYQREKGRLTKRDGGGKTVTRTGTANGRRVVQYSDGTIEYAD